MRLRFLDVETYRGPRRPVPAVGRILCSNVRAWPGTLVTWPWLRLSMIYCCALRFWSKICITCRRCLFLVSVDPVLLCRGNVPRARGMAAYVRDGYGAFRQPKFECGCCEMLGFRVCGVRQNLCVQSLSQPWPRWPDFWLFTSTNGCHAGWGYPYLFPVCGWFEWPSSGEVGFYDHEQSWSCGLWLRNSLWLRSFDCRPPHGRGGTVDLLMICSWLNTGCCCNTDR